MTPSSSKPTVRSYMTPGPHTIERRATLAEAQTAMRRFGVRHLPVVDGGRLVGILADRDVWLIETLKDVDPTEVLVEEAMRSEPYTIGPDSSLEWVAMEMAEHKYECVVVVDAREVVGVFTTIDALRALQQQLAEVRRGRSGGARRRGVRRG